MIAVYPAISLNMIAASSRVGIALGVPLEPDILGSPLHSMPSYHGGRKAEQLASYLTLFKKRVPFRGYPAALPMRAAKLRGSSSICRPPSPSDQRLERKRDSDDKKVFHLAMSGCYPTRSCDGYDGQRIRGITVPAKSRQTLR